MRSRALVPRFALFQKLIAAIGAEFDAIAISSGLAFELLYHAGSEPAVFEIPQRNKIFTRRTTPTISANDRVRLNVVTQVKALQRCELPISELACPTGSNVFNTIRYTYLPMSARLSSHRKIHDLLGNRARKRKDEFCPIFILVFNVAINRNGLLASQEFNDFLSCFSARDPVHGFFVP